LQQSERSLFDGFTFAIGLFLGAVAAAAAALTAGALSHTGEGDAMDEEMALAVAERIKPVGQVVLLGDEALAAAAAAVVAPAPVATVLSGPQVFNEACYLCHSPPGVPGAPVIGDRAAWEARVAQGLAVLQDHAINGYQGAAGFMPAKGGRVDLSDAEVLSAVDYMLEQLEAEPAQ
jgi:cytochrome c5